VSEEAAGGAWSSKNTQWVLDQASAVFHWFRRKFQKPVSQEDQKTQVETSEPGILIIGPAGTGKTTLAKLLSGQFNAWLFGDAWKYEESIGEETFKLFDAPNVEIVVPPGQKYRQDVSWAEVRSDITNGRYSGIILMTAFGYHTPTVAYKRHPLYADNISQFRTDYTRACLSDELAVLQFLLPAIESAAGRTWLLTLVGRATAL
jgi:hypothetical protein